MANTPYAPPSAQGLLYPIVIGSVYPDGGAPEQRPSKMTSDRRLLNFSSSLTILCSFPISVTAMDLLTPLGSLGARNLVPSPKKRGSRMIVGDSARRSTHAEVPFRADRSPTYGKKSRTCRQLKEIIRPIPRRLPTER